MQVKRDLFDATLPATPCTDEMSQKMRGVAEEHGFSLALLQRIAFDFFLSSDFTKSEVFQKAKRKKRK